MSNQTVVNIMGNHSFSSSMNGGGAAVPGASPGSPGLANNHGGFPGACVSQSYHGDAGLHFTGSISTTGGTGGKIVRAATGINIPSLGGSHVNLGPSNGNNGLGVHGPGRALNSMRQQGVLNQVQVASGSGQLGSVGLAGDGTINGTSFDLNDFPQLTSRSSSVGGSQEGSLMSLMKHNLSLIDKQRQEFSMQNEDFPALPGCKGGTAEFTTDLHHKDQQLDNTISLMQSPHILRGRTPPFNMGGSYVIQRQQQQWHEVQGGIVVSPSSGTNSTDLLHLHGPVSELFQPSHGPSSSYNSQVQTVPPPGIGSSQLAVANLRSGQTSAVPSMGVYEQQLLHHFRRHPSHSQFRLGSHQQQLSAIGQFREQTVKHMQRSHIASVDKYGLLGLLNVIRMSDPDITTLALGTDLTTLGLNLNSRENLNKTFASPWADSPIKGEPEFTLPQCYIQKPPRLQPGSFSKFQQETLFYIFYSMPSDDAQLYAANELCNRGWFYHKESHKWFSCVPNVEPLVKTNTYERGSYYFFDPIVWETGRKDNFVLQYEMVEQRLQLPKQH